MHDRKAVLSRELRGLDACVELPNCVKCGHQCITLRLLQKSEREKPHRGETNQHAPTQTPCNQLL